MPADTVYLTEEGRAILATLEEEGRERNARTRSFLSMLARPYRCACGVETWAIWLPEWEDGPSQTKHWYMTEELERHELTCDEVLAWKGRK